MDGEADDSWLEDSPSRSAELSVTKPFNKRSKAYSIDELLRDHYKDKNKGLDRELKQFRTYVSDSEDSENEEFCLKTRKEAQFEKLVETCEKQVHAGGATLDIPKWGEKLFTGKRQKAPATSLDPDDPVLQSLLASYRQYNQNPMESHASEQSAESAVAQLLASGWFLSLRVKLGNQILRWIFDTMTFTTDKILERAACNLLCHHLDTADCYANPSWIPRFKTFFGIFEAYGYHKLEISGDQVKKARLDSQQRPALLSPPHNLGSLLRFLSVSMKKRQLHKAYSRGDVEQFAVLIASLFLDRCLLPLSITVHECLEWILNSFREQEWKESCERIAISLAKVERSNVNCLKLTRSLHGRENRMKCLQSLVALQYFWKIANEKTNPGVWNILSVLRRIDVKRKAVDFGSLYYQICMADIWLWSNRNLDAERGGLEAWLFFLKSCSFQISSTDWRPYATKVRNHASYLVQVYQCHYQADDYEET
ncbi:hypothetical protein KP509_01G077500 [Ceratopteris richardii]|uniref:Coiled-coil SMC6 And NSE5 INteracting (CANIN) domain-containing protein n=1 Tax=Ceratopteris richardii TaxID=49495 RepID=A0A8T2VM39_CERRI|nr:hypothetical protein KP509_01G077500 [Ceratopteris richardii]